MVTGISFIGYDVLVISLFKIFSKCGEKNWKAFIPIYNLYILFKLVYKENMFWITCIPMLLLIVFSIKPSNSILLIISFILELILLLVILFIYIGLCNNMTKHFNKGVGFMLGLLFLPEIFMLILAFDKSIYKKISK